MLPPFRGTYVKQRFNFNKVKFEFLLTNPFVCKDKVSKRELASFFNHFPFKKTKEKTHSVEERVEIEDRFLF